MGYLKAFGIGFLHILVGLCLFSQISHAQVRLIQLTDSHSIIENWAKTMVAIDKEAGDFLVRHPRGEVIIHVIGDFTSISPYNASEGGWSSFEGLKLLRQRGHTILFTPGNHDGFDWTVKIEGTQLFLEQMNLLKQWGVEILASNLRRPTKALSKLLSESYPLRTINGNAHILGMTIPTIMSKSNLNEKTAKLLFRRTESYEESFNKLLPDLEKKGVDKVFFGIHQGYKKLIKQIPLIQRIKEANELTIRIPLIMGAHDHQVAALKKSGILFSNAGSHNSFSVIDINREGEILEPVRHIARSQSAMEAIDLMDFSNGRAKVNDVRPGEIGMDPWIVDYGRQLDLQIEDAKKKMSRVLFTTKGIPQNKQDLKRGQADLGSIITQTMVQWAKSTAILNGNTTPIVAFFNSSSYRIEDVIGKGEVTELTVRQMYPFLAEATLHHLTGREIHKLYFTLRKMYADGNKTLHSPQLNFGVREHNKRLQLLEDGIWQDIKPTEQYWLVLDGWLSDHLVGQSYRIKYWFKIFLGRVPLAKKVFQDILVEFLPEVVARFEAQKSIQKSLLPSYVDTLYNQAPRTPRCQLIFN